MPPRIAKFEKVSYFQFCNECLKRGFEPLTEKQFEKLPLPTRATAGSSGYDFFCPFSLVLKPGETRTIPTGVRVWIHPDWTLFALPKSGLGCKYRIQLDNTVGNIDSDYAFSDNEGHIMLQVTNDSHKEQTLVLEEPFLKIIQGVFLPYGITLDDQASGIRNGGFGSTGA